MNKNKNMYFTNTEPSLINVEKEFMLATNLSEANGPDDKLRMAFKMYDKDSSGNISQSKRAFMTSSENDF